MRHVTQLVHPTPFPGFAAYRNLMFRCGNHPWALFGGAVRDTILKREIHDFDIRVWVDPKDVAEFLNALRGVTGSEIHEVPSEGTGRIRYVLDYLGSELDISIRPIPETYRGRKIPLDAVARERAGDADIGLCSVAMDPLGVAYATKEFGEDVRNLTLSVYPSEDRDRLNAYARRMSLKFPDRKLVWLKSGTGL